MVIKGYTAKSKTKETGKKTRHLRQNKSVLRILWTFQPGWGGRRGGVDPAGVQKTDLDFSAFLPSKDELQRDVGAAVSSLEA